METSSAGEVKMESRSELEAETVECIEVSGSRAISSSSMCWCRLDMIPVVVFVGLDSESCDHCVSSAELLSRLLRGAELTRKIEDQAGGNVLGCVIESLFWSVSESRSLALFRLILLLLDTVTIPPASLLHCSENQPRSKLL